MQESLAGGKYKPTFFTTLLKCDADLFHGKFSGHEL
jgi:hypothetical protein